MKTFIRKEDKYLKTSTTPTVKFNLTEGSISPAALKLDLNKKGKIEECQPLREAFRLPSPRPNDCFQALSKLETVSTIKLSPIKTPKLLAIKIRINRDSISF